MGTYAGLALQETRWADRSKRRTCQQAVAEAACCRRRLAGWQRVAVLGAARDAGHRAQQLTGRLSGLQADMWHTDGENECERPHHQIGQRKQASRQAGSSREDQPLDSGGAGREPAFKGGVQQAAVGVVWLAALLLIIFL